LIKVEDCIQKQCLTLVWPLRFTKRWGFVS